MRHQLEPNMEQQTGSKLGKEYIKTVYCPPAYLTYMQSEKVSEVAQLCPTLCDLMNCSPPDSSVHGIFQARILEWVVMSPSRILPTQGLNPCLQHLLHWQEGSLPLGATREAPSTAREEVFSKQVAARVAFLKANERSGLM